MIDVAHTTLTVQAIACALLYALAVLRLLCYRPNGARHRPAVSAFASLLIGALSCRALAVGLGLDEASAPELLAALCVCALCFAIRGNLAALLRIWNHV